MSPASVVSSKRRPRRPVPQSLPLGERTYVEPTALDVLRGRGGRTNSHPGNQRLLELVRPLEAKYAALKRGEKSRMSQGMVDKVRLWGGRFLEKESDNHGQGLFYIMSPENAIKVVEQKFRDEPNKRKKRLNAAKAKVEKTKVGKSRVEDDDDDESVVVDLEPLDFKQSESWDVPAPCTEPTQSDSNTLLEASLVHCISPAHSVEDAETEVPSDDELDLDDISLTEEEISDLISDPFDWGKEFPPGQVADPSLCLSNDELMDLLMQGDDFFDIAS